MQKHVHVTPKGKKWAIKTENSQRAYKIVSTQKEAINIGRQVASNKKSELLIHGRDGKIREKNSYGTDNYPPKG